MHFNIQNIELESYVTEIIIAKMEKIVEKFKFEKFKRWSPHIKYGRSACREAFPCQIGIVYGIFYAFYALKFTP